MSSLLHSPEVLLIFYCGLVLLASLAEQPTRHLTWVGVALGLSLHSGFDGLAMAAAVVSEERGHGLALGLGTALAVILHKPFGALAITTLMAASCAAR
jgi:zinc transporter ZupT